MKIYGDIRSGNCYKIKLLTAILAIDHDWVDLDILAGETQTEAYLAKNPNGKIPLLELDDGRFLAESNAILNYLGDNSTLVPTCPYDRAKMLQWQFFEQYSHEPYIAVARYIALYLGLPDNRRDDYQAKQSGGHKALMVMEKQLTVTPYLVGDHLSLADISLYGYTHVANEGGFDLTKYPAVQDWLAKVASHKRYVSMG